ncbi:hypothetical protein F511_03960 [Dorcoceras hygrometricum]|uniref:Hydrogen peroxide induced protein 1 n=1 Tax=Dorcoceras hygrometricum TaxID=472368 RepID=A0A2Z7B088_9LAMI|nr:hypothetical protein F511_03960 [Dorcoceras hygrometricum]
MAVISQSLKLASFGKRFVSQIPSPLSSIAVLSSSQRSRGVHDLVYEKNQEELFTEHAHNKVVPDDVIPPQPEEYWAPHPQTGVFGPALDQNTAPGDISADSSPSTNSNSVLEQKAFFRHNENLDKPVSQP